MALLSALTHTLTSRKLTALVVAVSLCALSAITFLPQEASAQSVSDLSPLCRAALDTTGNQIRIKDQSMYQSQCNPAEKTIIAKLIQRSEQNQRALENAKATGSCSTFSFSFQDCIWIPLLSWLGSWFLTAGGGLVLLFGSIFQSLVDLVIIAFQKTLTDFGVLSRVDQWWVFVRNISNVLITKLVIDTSNYAAFQIYRTTSNQSQRFDLSKQFLEPIGITNIWDTKPVTDKAAAAAKGSSVGPAAAAFLYGLSGGLLLLLLTLVLVYGCWLLLGRAIALVVLMITAPFAFATYIIPRFAESEFGWSGWWRTLLNNAIFAPLFMIGLAVTFSILAASQHAASQSVTSAPQNLGS